jgi:hypothetical protein
VLQLPKSPMHTQVALVTRMLIGIPWQSSRQTVHQAIYMRIITEAKRRLCSFFFVGLLECFNESVQLFRKHTRLNSSRLPYSIF